MPKVKLYWVENYSCYDSYNDDKQIIRDIGEWEDITDEEYTLLRQNMGRLKHHNLQGFSPRLAVQDDVPIETRLLSIREHLQEIADAEEKAKLARQKKALAKQKQKENEARNQYEKLKAKFEGSDA